MKSAAQIGLKITAEQREYFRYTGVSAEMEQRGLGSSRPELAWARRVKKQESQRLGAALKKDDAFEMQV
jgi:hypothetical protein